MEHTLNVVESPEANATASLCSCGKMIGLITHEAVHAGNTGFYARHQHMVIELWERHRKQPRPFNPAECTIHLQGGPMDGETLTIAYHLYKGGYLFLNPPREPVGFRITNADMSLTPAGPIMYSRDPGNPLIWKYP